MMNKLSTILILTIFLTSIITGCGITGYTIVKTDESEKITTKEKAKIEKIEGVKETPKKSKQEILAENVKTQSLSIQKNAAPKILITEPDNNEIITNNQFTIWWKAQDPNNDKLLIKLEYRKEGQGNWVLIADNENNDRSFPWDLGALSDGGYKIRATVTDGILSSYNTKSFEIKR